jgi:hypothetical protein
MHDPNRDLLMSHEVRVHVRLGALRLEYEGTQAFYESSVEALVGFAAARGRPAAALATTSVRPEGGPTSDAQPAPPTAGDAARASEVVAPFVPKSPEFGRFLRRLGPEAGEPDRQVVAFAFYLWNYERRETFTLHEVAGCFQAVGLPTPAFGPTFADLCERKRFLEAAGDGAWRLTKKGENYVKTRLIAG